ncbi:MAG: bifunctional phosphopantothenoylcysteine decarboxylase/phosphopantothenate--cysteine ligase CoaBC [Calditrichaeota bacterium]|nr:bifunctional phosphopantothenoylcysteine decarboxylase/phosphopantothenate--cysteine ligase CoaBC [Calditrichota bacterium]MCB9391549.1 bifunctional phosphopantothenoylcysteine decarboxylase/phosphopantothenate--cysteine ligase CoaBC [Calditrichota bacterium]
MKSNRRPERDSRPSGDLAGRRILLGVTAGIAAYKAVELARLLIQAGAKVQVVMTPSATKFVTPLTFEAITARTVFVEMFPQPGQESPWHTELSTWADVVVVAPATADHIARVAHGFGDDLLTTILLACERRRLICPAMNPRMWANPAVQENVGLLKRHGYRIVPPEEGEMARPGEDPGVGRLAEPETIFAEVRHLLSAPQDLRGVRVLVTAGRTEESWDPVRVLTNRASGRMGFALAEEARERGADVTLVCGPTDVIPPSGMRVIRITTASQMAQSVKREFQHCNMLLMSAAVSDYTFASTMENKIKKGQPDPEVHLVPTEDILKSMSQNKGNRIIVGFALETENVLENALRKLREKHLDIVVANNPLVKGSGFQGETNQVFIIHRTGNVQDLPLQSKREVAREILNAVMEIYRNPLPEPEQDLELDLDLELDAAEELPVPGPGLVDLDGLDIEEADDSAGVANGSAPKPAAMSPAPGGKKKSRRGGRRARERRERQAAAIAAKQTGPQSSEHKPELKPAPEPVAAKTTAVVLADQPEKAKKKKSSRGKKKAEVKTDAPPAAQPVVAEEAKPKPAKKASKKRAAKPDESGDTVAKAPKKRAKKAAKKKAEPDAVA